MRALITTIALKRGIAVILILVTAVFGMPLPAYTQEPTGIDQLTGQPQKSADETSEPPAEAPLPTSKALGTTLESGLTLSAPSPEPEVTVTAKEPVPTESIPERSIGPGLYAAEEVSPPTKVTTLPTFDPTKTWEHIQAVDINKDNRPDMIGFDSTTGQWLAANSNSDGTYSNLIVIATWNPANDWQNIEFTDINKDGRADIIGRVGADNTHSGEWWVALSDPTTGKYSNQYLAHWNNANNWQDVQFADINKDGRADIIGRVGANNNHAGEWWVAISDPTTGKYSNQLLAKWNNANDWKDVQLADINNDGRADIIGRVGADNAYSGQWWVAISDPTTGKYSNQLLTKWNNANDWKDVQLADINNDGRADIIGRVGATNTHSGEWWVAISDPTTGKYSNRLLTHWNNANDWRDVQLADINNDGRADIIGRVGADNAHSGQWWVSILNSDGTVAFTRYLITMDETQGWANVQILDSNNDGIFEVIARNRTTGELQTFTLPKIMPTVSAEAIALAKSIFGTNVAYGLMSDSEGATGENFYNTAGTLIGRHVADEAHGIYQWYKWENEAWVEIYTPEAIAQLANRMHTSWDVNNDGQFNRADLDIIGQALVTYTNSFSQTYPPEVQEAFGTRGLGTGDIQGVIYSLKIFTDTSKSKTEREEAFYAMTDWAFDEVKPVVQVGGSDQLAQMMMAWAVERYPQETSPGPANYLMRVIKFIKKYPSDASYALVSDYINSQFGPCEGETTVQFNQRKQIALSLWQDHRVLVFYGPDAIRPNQSNLGIGVYDAHLRTLGRLLEIYKTNYPPYRESVFLIEFIWNAGDIYHAIGQGLINAVGFATEDISSYILLHEMAHVVTEANSEIASRFHNEFKRLFDESTEAGDYITFYHQFYTEDFTELITQWGFDSRALLNRALGRGLISKFILLEKVLLWDSLNPAKKDTELDMHMNEITGDLTIFTQSSIPITRDSLGRIASLNIDGNVYTIEYGTDGRVAHVGLTMSLAQPTAAAEAELRELYDYTGTVTLTNFTEHAFASPITGLRGYYTATIEGTDRIAWGIISESGELIQSGLAKATDPADTISLFATELGKFWTGREETWVLFQDVSNYLSAATNLSEEIQVSFLKGILDIFKNQGVVHFQTIFGMGSPICRVFQTQRISDRAVSYLTNRILSEWSLNHGLQANEMADNWNMIYSGLSVRATDQILNANPETARNLMRQLVDIVTSEDRSNHAGFNRLLNIVTSYHLNMSDYVDEPLLPGQDPIKALAFIRNQNPVSMYVARVAYDLSEILQNPDDIMAARAIAVSGVTTLVSEGLNGNLLAVGYILEVLNLSYQNPNIERFNILDGSTRDSLVDLVISQLDTYVEQPPIRLLKFLSLSYQKGALSLEKRDQIRNALETKLVMYVDQLLSGPLPPPEGDVTAFLNLLNVVAEISKAIGRKELVEPLLERFIVRFPGTEGFSSETTEAFQLRRDAILKIWRDYGVFIMDRINYLGRDQETWKTFESYMNLAGPVIGEASVHLFQISLHFFDQPVFGEGGPPSSLTFSSDCLNNAECLNAYRWRTVFIFMHELGHGVFNMQPLANNLESRQLLIQIFDEIGFPSSSNPFGNFVNYREDEAETFRHWFKDNQTVFNQAIDLASQGKTAVLEKYLFLAQMLYGSSDSFPMYQLVETPRSPAEGGSQYSFVLTGTMTIVSRDANGQITQMTDGSKTYTFIYEGKDLVRVDVAEPPIKVEQDSNGNTTDALIYGQSLKEAFRQLLIRKGVVLSDYVLNPENISCDVTAGTCSVNLLLVGNRFSRIVYGVSVSQDKIVQETVEYFVRASFDPSSEVLIQKDETEQFSPSTFNPGSYRLISETTYVEDVGLPQPISQVFFLFDAEGRQLERSYYLYFSYSNLVNQKVLETNAYDEFGRLISTTSTTTNYDYDDDGKVRLEIQIGYRAEFDNGTFQQLPEKRTRYVYDNTGNLIQTLELIMPYPITTFIEKVKAFISPEGGMTRDEKIQFMNEVVNNLPSFSNQELAGIFNAIPWPSIDQMSGENRDLFVQFSILLSQQVLNLYRVDSIYPKNLNFAVAFMAGLAKTAGQREVLDNFITAFFTRLVTDSFEETAESYSARQQALLDLWHNRGVIFMDYNFSAYNLKNIADLSRILSIYPARLIDQLNVIALFDRGNPGNSLDTSIILGVDKNSPSNTDQAKNGMTIASKLYAIIHEMGHHFETRKKVPNIAEFEQLSALSRPDSDDFVSVYARSNNNEDWAETVTRYVMDTEALRIRAEQQAQDGFPILLQKYLFVRDLFKTADGNYYGFNASTDFTAGELLAECYTFVSAEILREAESILGLASGAIARGVIPQPPDGIQDAGRAINFYGSNGKLIAQHVMNAIAAGIPDGWYKYDANGENPYLYANLTSEAQAQIETAQTVLGAAVTNAYQIFAPPDTADFPEIYLFFDANYNLIGKHEIGGLIAGLDQWSKWENGTWVLITAPTGTGEPG